MCRSECPEYLTDSKIRSFINVVPDREEAYEYDEYDEYDNFDDFDDDDTAVYIPLIPSLKTVIQFCFLMAGGLGLLYLFEYFLRYLGI